ncbi:MAG: diguanylate cyclase [Sulfuriferula sp.]
MIKNLLGLRTKLILVVGIGLLLGVSILGFFKLQQDRENLYREADSSGKERIALIAKALSNLLAGYDYTNMESFAGSIVAAPDVQILRIINRKGEVVVERTNKNRDQDGRSMTFKAPIVFGVEPIGSVEMLVSTNGLETAIRASLQRIVLWIGSVILFLSVLIYAAVSLVILTPIARIRNMMQEIVANPDSELQIMRVTGKDELADLTNIFNRMQTSLYVHQQKLKARVQISDENLTKANQELTLRSRELEQMVRLSQQLATTDSLTGLKNRRFLDENLGSIFAQAKRYADPLCLVLVDVDHFKKINDEYGHSSGDAVLKILGNLIRWSTRESDIGVRMGGDEFAFVLPRTSVMQSKVFAESLLEKTRNHVFAIPGEKIIKVSLSIGVAELSDDVPTVEMLYGAADKALYESKHRGRNQVTGIHKNKFL